MSTPTSFPVLRLLGTTTSPYTRKVRILAAAAQLPFEFVDTRSEAGVALLGRVAPLAKVPVLLKGDGEGAEAIPDSALITQWIWTYYQSALRAASFLLDHDMWEERATQTIIDGALDAAINRFYLLRDGSPDSGYVTRQRERVETVLGWLDGHFTFRRPCGVATLALGCGLDWMVFRNQVDLARWPGLQAFSEAWRVSRIGAGTEPG
jgi:glutathione S-transferase